MTTPETRQSEIKGFLQQQQELGGITPDSLQHETQILVETNNFMYEITVDALSFPTTRFILVTASPVCKQFGSILIGIDSSNRKLKYNIDNWIGKGTCMLLKFQSGRNVLSGEVLGASIIGRREDKTKYNLDVWG